MSLDWNLSKMRDIDELHNTAVNRDTPIHPEGSEGDERGKWEWEITKAIIFRCMAVGMWQITEANVEKFFVRSLIVSGMYGTPLMAYDKEKKEHVDRDLTLADLRRRIGLSTNASTLTDAQFRKKVTEHYEREATRELHRQRKALDEEKKA